MSRRHRPLARWAGTALAASVLSLVMSASAGAIIAIPPGDVITNGHTTSPAPDDPCLTRDGQTVSTTVNGPGPVGRCEPPAGFRVLDTAIWAWTLASLMALVIGLAVAGRGKALRHDRTEGPPETDRPESPDGGARAPV